MLLPTGLARLSECEDLHMCLETNIKADLDSESTTDVTFLC